MQESAQCFVDIDQLTTCWTEHIESQRVKENSLVDKTRVACKLYPGQMILKYCRNTTLTNKENTAHIYILRMLRYHSFYKANYSLRPASPFNIICCQTATKLKLSKRNSGAILRFVVKDLCPFSVVQNSVFQNLVHFLEPRYTILSRQHFSDEALLELYEQKKTELKSTLAEAIAMALAPDGWMSCATESYLTITYNYTDKEWKLQSNIRQV